MTDILDVSFSCGGHAADMAGEGLKTVIRYYSRNTGIPSKRLTRAEALQHVQAGLTLAAVHEARRGDLVASFTRDLGAQDAAYARSYASQTVGQPAGSAIYFAVDCDPTASEIKANIVPYFQGVAAAFAAPTGEPAYDVGVYGSGATCDAVLTAGLAKYAWLAQSKGWSGYAAFHKSGRWAMEQGMPVTAGGVDGDPDTANPNGAGFGAFTLAPAAVSLAPPKFVIARSGLRLRSGPGTEFETRQVLPLGTKVFPLGDTQGWTQVDLQGDGAADGYVSSGFLADRI